MRGTPKIVVAVSICFLDIGCRPQGETTGGAGATTPARTTTIPAVLDGFEDGDLESELRTRWGSYSDSVIGGSSTARLEIISEGAGGSHRALRLSGEVRPHVPIAFVGLGLRLSEGSGQLADVTGFEGLQFFARGDGNSCFVQLVTAAVKDHNYFSYEITATREWKRQRLPIRAFQQSPFFGRRVEWTGRDLRGLHFHAPRVGRLRIDVDELSFY